MIDDGDQNVDDHSSIKLDIIIPNKNYSKVTTGCLKKNAPLCLTGHRGYQKWTIDKSRVSFKKFRKFSF